MNITVERVNALACAVAVLEGTDGGYGPREKMEAKMELMRMLQEAKVIALRQLEAQS